MKFHKNLLILLFSIIVPISFAQESSEKALWEGGLGGVGIWVPDYPGAEQGKTRFIPAPWFFYRGPFLRVDEDGGARGRFVNVSRWEFDVSLGASFPANSADNRARTGMQDLDWIFEFGPKVIFYLIPKNYSQFLSFEVPARMVVSTDITRVDGRGYLTDPRLAFEIKETFVPWLRTRWIVAALFGNRQLNEYFYEVQPHEVIPNRSEYRAREGFMGTKLGVRMFLQATRNVKIIAGYTVTSFEGAANENSPLLKKKWTNTVAIGFLWRWFETEARGYQ